MLTRYKHSQAFLFGLTVAISGFSVSRGAHAAPKPSQTSLSSEYKQWLDHSRTAIATVRSVTAKQPGWRVVHTNSARLKRLAAGDRLLFVHRDRSLIAVRVGRLPLGRVGARLIAAHIDTPSPRLTTVGLTKKNQSKIPLHRYGGIRTHHWLHTPVAVVGRIVKRGGGIVDVELGLNDRFGFRIKAKTKRELELITSSIPAKGKRKRSNTFVNELHHRYGVTAADLETAELYAVPIAKARDVGLSGMLIGAHGQDDRINAFAAWRAIRDQTRVPQMTSMVWLVDREEVGSTGSVGARSRFLEYVYAYLIRSNGGIANEAAMHRAFAATTALSADTPPALNPNWPEVHESTHAPQLGKGLVMFPHTGHRGKLSGSAAHAELMRELIGVAKKARVPLQYAEIGRVDEGGGGTVAKYLGHRGIEVIDVGIPVISMHSPFEISAKADLWTGYLGYQAWLRATPKRTRK